MAERVDGNRGFANLQVFDENTKTLRMRSENANLHPKKNPTTPPVYYKTRARVEIKHEKRQKHYKSCGSVIKNR